MKLFGQSKTDMEPLYLEPSEDMAGVVFDKAKGKFEIYGVALPENVLEKFQPVIQWLENYQASPSKKTVLNFKLDYLNTASTKMMDKILEILHKIYINGYSVKVCWHYKHGDIDMQELGDELLTGYDFSKEFVAD